MRFLFLSAFLAACGTTTTQGTLPEGELPAGVQEDIGTIVATVGGFPVGSREFEAAAAREVPADGEAFSAEEKREILNKLVTEKMLYLHARTIGIDRDLKVQKVMVNTLLRDRVYSEVRNSDFTDEELQAYFDAHVDDFVVPEKVQVLRIFIREGRDRTPEEAASAAQELYERVLADPTNFKTIASEHSEDPFRRRGGDLGLMSAEGKPGIDPAVVERAFTMEVDELSEPFEAGDGYNIILVAAKRDRVERTFVQMKGSVLRKVKAERYHELYDAFVAEISGGFEVSIADGELDSLDPRPARRSPLGAPPAGLGRQPGLRQAAPPPEAGE